MYEQGRLSYFDYKIDRESSTARFAPNEKDKRKRVLSAAGVELAPPTIMEPLFSPKKILFCLAFADESQSATFKNVNVLLYMPCEESSITVR